MQYTEPPEEPEAEMPRAEALLLVLLAASLCVADSLTLGGRVEQDKAGLQSVGGTDKRDGRRITRDRYRMGYLFGKRSDMDSNAGLLLTTLTR